MEYRLEVLFFRYRLMIGKKHSNSPIIQKSVIERRYYDSLVLLGINA